MTELTGGGGDHRVYTLTGGDSEWWVVAMANQCDDSHTIENAIVVVLN